MAARAWISAAATLLAALHGVACSSTAPAAPPAAPAPRTVDALARLRVSAELARMRGEDVGPAGTRDLVFDGADIARVREAMEAPSTPPRARRELEALYRFLLAEWLERRRPEIAPAADGLERGAIFEALAERSRRHRRLARELGFRNIVELATALHGAPAPSTELARAVLRASAALFAAGIAELTGTADRTRLDPAAVDLAGPAPDAAGLAGPTVGITESAHEAVRLGEPDLEALLAGDPLGRDIDAADIDELARAALERMGLQAPESRVGSSVPALGTRAIVMRDGDAVSVRLPAIGGGRGLAAAVAGVAAALRWVVAPPPLEHPSLVASHDPWPVLWARLTADQHWVRASSGVDAAAAAAWERVAAIAELAELRREAALALIDAELAAGWTGTVADVVRRHGTRAFGPGADHLLSSDALRDLASSPPFAAGARLRERVQASRLTAELVARVGPCWWSNPESGAMIREAWAQPETAGAPALPATMTAAGAPADAPTSDQGSTSADARTSADAPTLGQTSTLGDASTPGDASSPNDDDSAALDAELVLRPLAERLASGDSERSDAPSCPHAPSS